MRLFLLFSLPNPIGRLREGINKLREKITHGAHEVAHKATSTASGLIAKLNPFTRFSGLFGSLANRLGPIGRYLGHYSAIFIQLAILFLIALGLIRLRGLLKGLGTPLGLLSRGPMQLQDALFIRAITEDIGAMAYVLNQHLAGSLITLLGYGILVASILMARKKPRLIRLRRLRR